MSLRVTKPGMTRPMKRKQFIDSLTPGAARFCELLDKASLSARYEISPDDYTEAEGHLSPDEFSELVNCRYSRARLAELEANDE